MTVADRRKCSPVIKFFARKLLRIHNNQCEITEKVPNDVKEGHFAVLVGKTEEESIRFVVELCVLKHPGFLKLLEMAEEEYGFEQQGALAVPCEPLELVRILQDLEAY